MEPTTDRLNQPRTEGRLDEIVLGSIPNGINTDLTVSWTRKRRWRGRPDYWHLEFRGWSKHPDGSRTPIPGFGFSVHLNQIPALCALVARANDELEVGRDGSPYRAENAARRQTEEVTDDEAEEEPEGHRSPAPPANGHTP